MATHAPMARVPFASLDSPRLQHLASAKNRQNGILAQKSPLSGKANISLTKPTFSPVKRPFDPSEYDDNDSENVDPALLFSPSKKSKSDVEKPIKPFTFSLAPVHVYATSSNHPIPSVHARQSKHFVSSSTHDCPSWTIAKTLDAALSGTFSSAAPKVSGATIQESMPKNWFFDVYEDTPEEVSATLMEHSTLTLDLSSDEESSRKEKDEKGKENMPPADYDAVTASRPVAEPAVAAPKHIKKADIIRRKIISVDDMDDGLRSPLSDLETEPFISEGLNKDSHVIVAPALDKSTSIPQLRDVSKLFATAVPFTSGSEQKSNTSLSAKSLYDMPVVTAEGDLKGEIIVWEDSSSPAASECSVLQDTNITPTKAAVADENTLPASINTGR